MGFLKLNFILYVWLFCLCITCVPGAHRGQKRTLNPLELDLQTVVSLLTLGPYTQPILFSFVVVFVCLFVCLILEIAWEHVAQCSLKLSDPSALVSWCMPLHPAHFL